VVTKGIRRVVFPVLATSLLAACVTESGGETGVEVGQVAPAYGATTLSGDSAYLADLREDVVLLNVWATWCPPCRDEIPALQALHETYSDRGLQIVGVSVDAQHDRDNIRPFADGYGVTYTLWHDPADEIRTRFRVIGVPTTLLIDREGRIVWRHVGPVTEDDPGLNAAVQAALEDAGTAAIPSDA
jgi:peroxiredoxin